MSKLEEDNDHGYFAMPHTPIFQEDDDFEDEVEQGVNDLDDDDEDELDDDDDDYDDFDDEDEDLDDEEDE